MFRSGLQETFDEAVVWGGAGGAGAHAEGIVVKEERGMSCQYHIKN